MFTLKRIFSYYSIHSWLLIGRNPFRNRKMENAKKMMGVLVFLVIIISSIEAQSGSFTFPVGFPATLYAASTSNALTFMTEFLPISVTWTNISQPPTPVSLTISSTANSLYVISFMGTVDLFIG